MTPSQLHNRVFLAGASIAMIIVLCIIFVSDPAIGALIAYISVLTCFAYFRRLIDRTPIVRRAGYSDIDGPNQGFDPRTIEAMRRRANGIE